MKQFFVVALSCLLVLGVAACGEEEPEPERVGMEEERVPAEPSPEPVEPAPEPAEPAPEPAEPAPEPAEPEPEPTPEPVEEPAEPEVAEEPDAAEVMLGDIDINTATQSELEQLEGVGPATAGNIIDYRDQQGPFNSVNELTNVSGIGPATLENMKEAAGVEVAADDEPEAAPAEGDININTASQAELEELHRVGPATAQSIIEYREQHGDFSSVDELTEVSGIGPATVGGLDRATVE